MSYTAKVLFVIDGVAERKTTCMLNDYLVPQLNFPCFVQVVANYVLAFDLITNNNFDAIVLPRMNALDHFSTDDFVDIMTNLADFTGSLIHTVDYHSVAHVRGRTVRSSKSGAGGYVIDDLLAAISFAVKEAYLPELHQNARIGNHQVTSCRSASLSKSNKRPRRDISASSHLLASNQDQYRPSKHSKQEQDQLCFSSRAEEAAYLHYCQWYQWQQWQQWQLFAHAHAHGPFRYTTSAAAVVTDSSAISASIPSPHLVNLPLHHPHFLSTQHHNRTPHPLHLGHQFPVFSPHVPIPGPHLHYHHHAPPPQQQLPHHDHHLHSVKVHSERVNAARADSFSTVCSHSTNTSTTSTATTASTTESAAWSPTEEEAIHHAADLLASSYSDSLSTLSVENCEDLFEFMNEGLWDFE